MRKQEIEFRDPVVQSVVNKFVDRSDVGFAKYGKTLRADQLDIFTWLNHLQEELMDATLYLQRLKEEISALREEKELLQSINDIDVIDAFEVPAYRPKKKTSVKKSGHGRSFTIDPDPSDNQAIEELYKFFVSHTNPFDGLNQTLTTPSAQSH